MADSSTFRDNVTSKTYVSCLCLTLPQRIHSRTATHSHKIVHAVGCAAHGTAQYVLQWSQLLVVMQVFQRQMSKEGLQAVVNGNDAAGGGWSSEMLRDLFTLREDIASDTYDSRCRSTEESIVDGDDEAGPLPPPEYKQQVLWRHRHPSSASWHSGCSSCRHYVGMAVIMLAWPSSCWHGRHHVGMVRQLPILQLACWPSLYWHGCHHAGMLA